MLLGQQQQATLRQPLPRLRQCLMRKRRTVHDMAQHHDIEGLQRHFLRRQRPVGQVDTQNGDIAHLLELGLLSLAVHLIAVQQQILHALFLQRRGEMARQRTGSRCELQNTQPAPGRLRRLQQLQQLAHGPAAAEMERILIEQGFGQR